MEALTKSSGLGEDQVGPQDQIASAEGQDVKALTKSSGVGEDQVGSQDQIASAEGPGCAGSDQVYCPGGGPGRITRPDCQC